MNETGPEEVPPPESGSSEPRSVDRLLPVPEPYLKSSASVSASFMIDDMLSSTELMKQALHCGRSKMPTLNQTGELKQADWSSSRVRSSCSKVSASSPSK